MNARKREEICRELTDELEDMARWLSGGQLSPSQFRLLVTSLEHRKLKNFGLQLSSSASESGSVHFTLRFADSDDLCASMDVDPLTGEFSTQHTSPEFPRDESG